MPEALPAAIPQHQIRASHTDTTVTVYQAYAPRLGLPAARDGRFPDAWKRERMTWIKPSLLWMMYRCGWAAKADQETVLAVEITRAGFDGAVREACLSHYDPDVHPDHAAWKQALRTSPSASSGTRNATCTWTRCRTARSNWGCPDRRHGPTPTSGRSPSAT